MTVDAAAATSGEQYAIEGFDYAAVVTEVGGTLRMLEHAGRALVAGFEPDELRPNYAGALLAPWPNRLADGSYRFRDVRHQLPINELDRVNALHGLVAWLPWTLVWHAPDRVELSCRLFPQEGYPFWLELSVAYAVTPTGLRCRLEAHNFGNIDLPYGCGPHPYLVPGDGSVDDWTLEIPATQYLDLTPDRFLPNEIVDVSGTPYDFRTAHKIESLQLNTPYTSFETTAVRVLSANGDGVSISWDDSCPWVQVFTSDFPGSDRYRTSLAVEPMTCPPNAFNSGTDLVVLGPGDRHAITWTIATV